LGVDRFGHKDTEIREKGRRAPVVTLRKRELDAGHEHAPEELRLRARDIGRVIQPPTRFVHELHCGKDVRRRYVGSHTHFAKARTVGFSLVDARGHSLA
jgi:hypothetical protein